MVCELCQFQDHRSAPASVFPRDGQVRGILINQIAELGRLADSDLEDLGFFG